MEYDQAARKRLGRAVRSARIDAGFSNREAFASKLGRSGRQVQALENGESGVGPDTMAAAAKALGWELERVYAILDGESASAPSTGLATASDEELAAEVLRRMKAGGEHGGDTAATKEPGSGPDGTDHLAERRSSKLATTVEAGQTAARHGKSAGKAMRAEIDAAGEESQDDGGMNPA